ncbi:MAG: glucose-6-phosphate dehydrogenase (NADP(+)), partial [Anaerolineales bacterium]|nr:glucose-6-phosphate dehydrogenase (NADP(+)) [Anaerolineales bacterium]
MSDSTTMIIFGASGDLTQRKLIPALLRAYRLERLPGDFRVVGFARRPWDHEQFRAELLDGLKEFAAEHYDEAAWQKFSQNIFYVRGDLDKDAGYASLKRFLEEVEPAGSNRLYYLATAPQFFGPVAAALGSLGMVKEDEGWRRLVVEKPFGTDLASAQALNEALHAEFQEGQIYHIDHYLGKETAQNILFLRFANTIFEPVWNRNYVANVQISVAEEVDVGHRAGYYDTAGVVRDMFQNHLLQLLALVAMEPPASFQADAVRNERVKLLGSIRPIDLQDTVRAQYHGYCELDGVAA